MHKITSPPSKWKVELGVWEVVSFLVPEEIVYSFFNFLFDIFWNSINLVFVSHLGEKDLVYDYLPPLKESLTLFQYGFFFAIHWLILSHLELSRIELPKLTSRVLMEIAIILVAWLINSLFIWTRPYRLGFSKKMFLS